MNFRAVNGIALTPLVLCVLVVPSIASSRPQATTQRKQAPQANRANAAATTPAAKPRPMTPAEIEEMHGDVLLVRKMYQQAIATYQDVLLQEPKHARLHKSKLLDKIGVCYQELDLPKQAEHFYKKAAKTDKHFAAPQNNLGTVDFGRHKYKGAIKHFKKAVKLDPKMAAAYSNLGYAYLARKKYRNAILAFRRTILIDPTFYRNRGRAGEVIEQRGNEPPGLFYYMLAKTFAILGDAKSCAHYLKMSRDEGYKKYTEALKDPAFKAVLKDPRVKAILEPKPNQTNSNATVVSKSQ